MNLIRPHRLAAATAFCVLGVLLPATGCGAAAPRGSPVLGAGIASKRMSAGQHIARNEGSTPVTVVQAYLNVPPGGSPRIDAPAPGNCPF